jgi:hypothetical protein
MGSKHFVKMGLSPELFPRQYLEDQLPSYIMPGHMEQNPRRLPLNATFEDFEAFFSVQLLPDEKILFPRKGR